MPARAIAEHLPHLISLNLRENALTQFVVAASELARLQTLDLSRNQLVHLDVAHGALPELRRFAVANNGLISLPCGICSLPELEWLDLRENSLRHLSTDLSRSPKLRWLSVRDNSDLALPAELLEDKHVTFPTEPGRPNFAAISQWLARQTGTRRRLNEAKVLLVGQGGVGKTSLVRYIVDDLPRDREEARTDGILIRQWPGVRSAEHPAEHIQLNIWDFGGQEIMHATHQFFLTQRSLYLLVLDARKGEQEGNLHYWLGLISGLGGDSPVIVVTNQCDGGNDLSLNEPRLRLDYPNIRAFVKTSCDNGRGIEELRRLIAQEINGLASAKEQWPEAWFLIKQELADRARQSHHVDLDTYHEICRHHNVTDPDEQANVLRFLHDLGVVLYYDDPRLAYDPRLRERMILDPGWITDGVYRVLTSPHLLASKGVLDVRKLPDMMAASKSPYTYDAQGQQYILGMMQKFELSFEFSGRDHRHYLVPERLDEHEPRELDWNRPDALRFQVSYSVLPGGVIPRLITRTAAHHAVKPPPWHSGVVLSLEGCDAYVRGDRQKNRIFIHVHGESDARRRALAVIRHELKEINATLPGITTKELVPLPQEPDVTVEYEYLLQLERDGDDEFRPQGATRRYRVRELLDGVGIYQLVIERDFESFTDADVAALLQSTPGMYARSRIVEKRRGSVRLILEIPDSLAAQLAERIPGGLLSHLGIVAIKRHKQEQLKELKAKIDVGIMTVRADEFDAVLDRLNDSRPVAGGRNLYEYACLTTPHGDARVVACRCPEQGEVKAASVARNLLEDLAPRWLVLVGIAGGFPDTEFTLGDVLVASRVHDFSVTAALEGRLPELDTRGGPLHRDVEKLVAYLPAHDRRIVAWADAQAIRANRPNENVPAAPNGDRFYGPPVWQEGVWRSLTKHLGGVAPRTTPKLVVAPDASGNTVLMDATLAMHWKRAARSAASVEMELAGVYEAVHAQQPDCRLLGVRGISDIVGYKRDPAWTEYASHSAASFTHALIASGILLQVAGESTAT